MARYKTKPFEIEAERYHHSISGFSRMQHFCGYRTVEEGWNIPIFDAVDNWIIDPPEGIVAAVYDELQKTWVGVRDGDYIIKGSKGEYYPCDPEVFESKYELADIDKTVGAWHE